MEIGHGVKTDLKPYAAMPQILTMCISLQNRLSGFLHAAQLLSLRNGQLLLALLTVYLIHPR